MKPHADRRNIMAGWSWYQLMEPTEDKQIVRAAAGDHLVNPLADSEHNQHNPSVLTYTESKTITGCQVTRNDRAIADLLIFLQGMLATDVERVRLSNRLVSAPACLTKLEDAGARQVGGPSRTIRAVSGRRRRIMELNPNHAIFLKMCERFEKNGGEVVVGECAELLLGYALLAEGSGLSDPPRFTSLLAECILQVLWS